ncbi:transketolase-like protein 2 [Perognathus longimembris pacificus]|uniref:transketolase-like protein 2 n=1 Tax=Perognathus longimembris pacificus TaxID=214514 RepID=UPI002018DDD0|nr:transketolase-like protein 2 [Perognathus longimembris pacificus]
MATAKGPNPDAETVQVLQDVANRLRIHAIRAACASGSGAPRAGCGSAAETVAVLFFHTMRYKPAEPSHPDNDRLVLAQAHAAPLLHAAWAEAAQESDPPTPRRVEGEPPPPPLGAAPGPLGQGLGAACGMAFTGKYFDQASYRVFCLVGDAEASGGAVWEALAFGAQYNLDNLVAVFEVSCPGPGGAAPSGRPAGVRRERCEAFGWNTDSVDGHDVEQLCQAFWRAAQVKNRPTAIIVKTVEGWGLPNAEDAERWRRGTPLPPERAEAAIRAIGSRIKTHSRLAPKAPAEDSPQINLSNVKMASPPAYKLGEKMATGKASGLALAKLGHAHKRVIVLDSDTKSSTFSEIFKKEHPERFIECLMAEPNMVSVALGCAARGRTIAFASTFAAFFTRAFDQIRMGAISDTNINLIGSHSGVSFGEDGPYQMALEDLAMFRSIPNCTIFYPSDATATEHAVYLAASTKGMCFIRTSQPEAAVIYTPHEHFEVGQAKVIRHGAHDKVTVIGAGVTLHEALAAADDLFQQGISVRVIDLFTIKPLDAATIISNAKATGGRIITVEDHYREGGIGEAVCAAVSGEPDIQVHRLAVTELPRSGKPGELLDMFGISARHIIAAVKYTLMN